jgi:hypothetical protein
VNCIKIDRLHFACIGLAEKSAERVAVEVEAGGQQLFELAAFDGIDLAVDRRGVHEKRCGGEPKLLLAQSRRRAFMRADALGEILEFGPQRHRRKSPPSLVTRHIAQQGPRKRPLLRQLALEIEREFRRLRPATARSWRGNG